MRRHTCRLCMVITVCSDAQEQKSAASQVTKEWTLHSSYVHTGRPQHDILGRAGETIHATSQMEAVIQQNQNQTNTTDPDAQTQNVGRVLDNSIRCQVSSICDDHRTDCATDPDGLACLKEVDQRRAQVVAAIKWAWNSYRRCAWGYDEVQPISCTGHQWFGLGLAMIDSLDTLILAGFDEVITVLSCRTRCNSKFTTARMSRLCV